METYPLKMELKQMAIITIRSERSFGFSRSIKYLTNSFDLRKRSFWSMPTFLQLFICIELAIQPIALRLSCHLYFYSISNEKFTHRCGKWQCPFSNRILQFKAISIFHLKWTLVWTISHFFVLLMFLDLGWFCELTRMVGLTFKWSAKLKKIINRSHQWLFLPDTLIA